MRGDSHTVAVNTLFLYTRMVCVIAVSLYTSRVVLSALGAVEYGIYQTVSGVVVLLSFANSALATGTSRFLTYELGRGGKGQLGTMFSTLLMIHISVALIIVVLGEPIGLYIIQNQLNLLPEQVSTVVWVYQCSLVIAFVTITQIPYTGVIIAHENMKIYAYGSLLEVILRLFIAVMIPNFVGERLLVFAILMCASQIIVALLYRIYCRRHYTESILNTNLFDSNLLQNVGEFSGYSLLAAVSVAAIHQGTNILLNMFFSPVVVAARCIADQVNGTVSQFIHNFRMAINPRIVKRYAGGDADGTRRLVLSSACYSYYLMLVFAVPLFFLSEYVLSWWLVEVPPYTDMFLKWSMVQSLFSVFDISFYSALYASGRLKENALQAPIIDVIAVLIVYILFNHGYSPIVICYSYTACTFVQGVIQKPFLLWWKFGYEVCDFLKVFCRCAIVTVGSICLPYIVQYFCLVQSAVECVQHAFIMALWVAFIAWSVGINREDKAICISILKRKIN